MLRNNTAASSEDQGKLTYSTYFFLASSWGKTVDFYISFLIYMC